jgi:DNA-damage-inducible protein J
MANTLVQFRAEETTRIKAASICEKLGIDLQTYLRMCMSRLVQENGIPFSMRLDDGTQENPGLRAMKAASRIAAENGISDLSLDEINAEIAAARGEGQA